MDKQQQTTSTGKIISFNKEAVDLGDVFMELNRSKEVVLEKRTNKFKLKLGCRMSDKRKSAISEVKNNLSVN